VCVCVCVCTGNDAFVFAHLIHRLLARVHGLLIPCEQACGGGTVKLLSHASVLCVHAPHAASAHSLRPSPSHRSSGGPLHSSMALREQPALRVVFRCVRLSAAAACVRAVVWPCTGPIAAATGGDPGAHVELCKHASMHPRTWPPACTAAPPQRRRTRGPPSSPPRCGTPARTHGIVVVGS